MATCGYVCPKCEGKGFLENFFNCDWCSTTPIIKDNMITIYHNKRCGKSRDALAILNEKNVEFKVVDYIKTPPTTKELAAILQQLNMTPIDLIRKGETIYKENYKDKTLTNAEWIQIMVNNPILIERPIIINGDKAVIGRPPEKVLEIL
jgi:arsenate reductase